MSTEAITSPDLYKQETFQVAMVAQDFTARSPLMSIALRTEQWGPQPWTPVSRCHTPPRGERSPWSHEVCSLPDPALGPREFLPPSCLTPTSRSSPGPVGTRMGLSRWHPQVQGEVEVVINWDTQTSGTEDCGDPAQAPGFAPLPQDSRRAHPQCGSLCAQMPNFGCSSGQSTPTDLIWGQNVTPANRMGPQF